jgi:hypothetical protein
MAVSTDQWRDADVRKKPEVKLLLTPGLLFWVSLGVSQADELHMTMWF